MSSCKHRENSTKAAVLRENSDLVLHVRAVMAHRRPLTLLETLFLDLDRRRQEVKERCEGEFKGPTKRTKVRRESDCTYNRDTLNAAAAKNHGTALLPFLWVKDGPVYPMLKEITKEASRHLSFALRDFTQLFSWLLPVATSTLMCVDNSVGVALDT